MEEQRKLLMTRFGPVIEGEKLQLTTDAVLAAVGPERVLANFTGEERAACPELTNCRSIKVIPNVKASYGRFTWLRLYTFDNMLLKTNPQSVAVSVPGTDLALTAQPVFGPPDPA